CRAILSCVLTIDFCICIYRTTSMSCFFFFFSSRRRHTRSKRDWSSDVCSSDLMLVVIAMLIAMAIALPLGMLIVERPALRALSKIGRASCRERVWIWVGAGAVKEKDRSIAM